MQDLILHHYWPSPVAHKVRTVLGIKNLSWLSVEIPRIPPKPDVVALTGGYRRTPVMQFGADVFCDSLCIINEVEKRFPGSLKPEDTALHYGFSRWADGELLEHCIRIVLGSQVESLDPAFLADRARLYFGPDWTAESIRDGVAHSLSQFEIALSTIDTRLAEGSDFLCGDSASLSDAYLYYLLWFVRGRHENGAALIQPFANTRRWEQRLDEIGHGTEETLDSKDAIKIASDSTPELFGQYTAGSARQVSVVPDSNGGDPEVIGRLVLLDDAEIVIERELAESGTPLHVHFPRTGYLVNTPA